jgi:hypothetical protein
MTWPSGTFSALIRQSLPQPRIRLSIAGSKRIGDFNTLSRQKKTISSKISCCSRMAIIWPKQTFHDMAEWHLLCVDPTELAATEDSTFDRWLETNPQFRWASINVSENEPSKAEQNGRHSKKKWILCGLQAFPSLHYTCWACYNRQEENRRLLPFGIDDLVGFRNQSLTSPTNNQPGRMITIRSKITFGVVDKRPLLYIIPVDLSATERKTLNDSLAIELRI